MFLLIKFNQKMIQSKTNLIKKRPVSSSFMSHTKVMQMFMASSSREFLRDLAALKHADH